jgi:hypothetical protein
MARIQGTEYDLSDFRFFLGGVVISLKFTEFEWMVESDKENLYGSGSKDPQGRRHGKNEYSGSISMRISEIEKLRAIARPFGNGLHQIPMSDTTLLASKSTGILAKVFEDFEFMQDGWPVGDGDNIKQLSFIYSRVRG